MEVESEIAIADLRDNDPTTPAIGGALTITHESGRPPDPDRLVFAWPGRYAARLGTVGDDWLITSRLDGAFRIDSGLRTIRLYS